MGKLLRVQEFADPALTLIGYEENNYLQVLNQFLITHEYSFTQKCSF